jgi:hypothetical protein
VLVGSCVSSFGSKFVLSFSSAGSSSLKYNPPFLLLIMILLVS